MLSIKYNLKVQKKIKQKIELDTCVRLSGLTIDIFCNVTEVIYRRPSSKLQILKKLVYWV